MRLFAKRHPKLAKLAGQGNWMVGEATNDGRPMFLRINAAAKRFIAHPDLPYRFGVAVGLREPDERGLPQSAEMTELNRIEDALMEALEPALDGFLVAVITTGGMREFVFYIRDPQCAPSAIAAANECCQGHELQHYVQSDPQWLGYQEFTG